MITGCGDSRTDEEKIKDITETIKHSHTFLSGSIDTISAKDATTERKKAENAMQEYNELKKNSKDPVIINRSQELQKQLYQICKIEQKIVCQHKYKKLLQSYKVKGYLLGRQAIYKYTLKSLAYAARKTADTTVPAAQKTADTTVPAPQNENFAILLCAAKEMVELVVDIPQLPHGKTDWIKVSEKLDDISQTPPPELNLVLAGSHLISGGDKLVLAELSLCDTEKFTETKKFSKFDKVLCYHIIKIMAFHKLSWYPLTEQEFEIIQKMSNESGNESESQNEQVSLNDLKTGWHLYQAYHFLCQKRDFAEADQHISWLIRLNPNSKAITFITGEKKGENGQIEKTPESLVNHLKDENEKRIVEIIANRIRAIRDSKPIEPPPKITADPIFVIKIIYAWATAKSDNSKIAEKCIQFINTLKIIDNKKDNANTHTISEKPENPKKKTIIEKISS